MSEQYPNTPESIAQYSDVFQMVEMLTSDVRLGQVSEKLEKEIEDNPELAHYSKMQDARLEATRRFYKAETADERQEFDDFIREIDSAVESTPRYTVDSYKDISNRRRMLDTFKAVIFDGDELEASMILENITKAPKFQDVPNAEAPFEDYTKNDRNSWQYVDDESVRDFLTSRIFRDTNEAHRSSQDSTSLIIRSSGKEELSVPVDMLVDIQGFDSWLGREGEGRGKDVGGPYEKQYEKKVASLDVIKHYAALPSELPPVSEIYLFVQPNGVMFGDNGSGDSHRIAAAILRGHTAIKANEIHIKTIDYNIFEPLEENDRITQ